MALLSECLSSSSASEYCLLSFWEMPILSGIWVCLCCCSKRNLGLPNVLRFESDVGVQHERTSCLCIGARENRTNHISKHCSCSNGSTSRSAKEHSWSPLKPGSFARKQGRGNDAVVIHVQLGQVDENPGVPCQFCDRATSDGQQPFVSSPFFAVKV